MIKKAKVLHIILSALLIPIGIGMVVWPQTSARTIAYILGGFTLLYGILKIISYFSKDIYNLAFQFDLALGVFNCVIGCVLLLHPDDLVTMLPIILGITILIDGSLKLQTALDARLFGLNKWWTIIVFAILTSLMGICLILKPFDGARILMVIMGIACICDGIQNLCVTIYTVKLLKEKPDIQNMYIKF